MTEALRLTGLLETSLYVGDLDRSERFYREVFELEPLFGDARMRALAVAGSQVLLLFVRGGSVESTQLPGGMLPGHDGSGTTHYAFSVEADLLERWEQRLLEHGVQIESRMQWERGGRSLYFRDPDGHLGELVTPGCWTIY